MTKPKPFLTFTIHSPERGKADNAPLNVPSAIISAPIPMANTNKTVVPKKTLPCVPT